ncbi:probable LRR receptor-like protein kinase At1g51890 [Lolium rigidum]|uniref:probable LRR receptor-like protein kinase At1g51890 n=1 Tax=Lolium rigidum TaxID=89674 RepID=UPI001F5C190C|nr:probable LRR receptor-like protein kinase At1g51890 [Lolium rigidum]
MELSTPLAMTGGPWLLILCLAAGAVLQACAQPDSKGFISIDCGLSGKTGYMDDKTKISYSPDAGFIDVGTNHNISAKYMHTANSKHLHNLRSFAGMRNCYTLRSLVPGAKYIIRATFKYGNYDGLNRPPAFDLHVGVNYRHTVDITNPYEMEHVEVMIVVPDDFVQVCLVNTGAGAPYISSLDLRPLDRSLYPQVTAAQGLALAFRINFGPTDHTDIVRYPDDPHDRIWYPWLNDWTEISTTQKVYNSLGNNSFFMVPSAVLQTAVIPLNVSRNIKISWISRPTTMDPGRLGCIVILYFAELQVIPANAVRQMNVVLNDKPWYTTGFTPEYRYAAVTYNTLPFEYLIYELSIEATNNATLPPFINAAEIFFVFATTNLGTDSQDVSAITAIKAKYRVTKNWMGDPCVPKTMAWDSLTCSYTIDSRSRITSVNLSSSGLNGDISSYFTNLKAVQSLDLSNNNLIGSIPEALAQLPFLTVLDLSGNQLNGSIPSGLLKRIQEGSLKLIYGNNPNLCINGNSCQLHAKKNSKLALYIAVPAVLLVVIVLVAILLICLLKRKKQGSVDNSIMLQNETVTSHAIANHVADYSSLQRLESRRFTYKELEIITNNFQQVLGQGGFGYVYSGFLEDGAQVAVKLRSHSSNQGVKEFLAEAEILTRIHHMNLVSMVGYCMDGEYMALIYEYMPEGTLQEHIEGSNRNGACLSWPQRLRIALESAQGLEYLHKGCNPPIIHRDVKATNILLNSKLEARIADFGLSKAFNSNDTHVYTNTLVGTPGYVDPEYQATMQLTTKSDVYSFGIVLLELVTGKPAILREPEPINIISWARQRLAQGNIEAVVDERMGSDYDVNSVWKAADLALKCTAYSSMQRPTMTDMVAQLHECIELENAGDYANTGVYTSSSDNDPNMSYDAYPTDQSSIVRRNSTAFEMEHNLRRKTTMPTGPDAR